MRQPDRTGQFASARDKAKSPALACPGRVRLRVNVQANGIAGLAIAGTGLELGPVGHDDVDLMMIGMNIGLHGARSQ